MIVVVWHINFFADTVGTFGHDALTYLGAGERLNAGHALYMLQAGDRWVQQWAGVPFFYPPTIALMWRPLALLPDGWGIVLWMMVSWTVLAGSVVILIDRTGVPGALLVAMLAIPLAWELEVGNVNAFVLAGALLIWACPRVSAPVVGVLASVKLTPAVLLVWLFATGRRREAFYGAAVAVTASIVALMIVGPSTLERYIRAVLTAPPSPISVAGLLGVPSWLAPAIGVAVIVVLALRGAPTHASYVAAVVTMVLGSPSLSLASLVVLLAVLAPLAWRRPEPRVGGAPHPLERGRLPRTAS